MLSTSGGKDPPTITTSRTPMPKADPIFPQQGEALSCLPQLQSGAFSAWLWESTPARDLSLSSARHGANQRSS